MSRNHGYLTKSLFKLAMECPTKLHYAGKPDYVDASVGDSFLEMLAEGGFQVGALGCLMYPGGVQIADGAPSDQVDATAKLLQRRTVTIYEAAIEAGGLFARVDILRKRGSTLELIEVKAKSYDPTDNGNLRSARGAIASEYLPYVLDVAFQRHVLGLRFPKHHIRSFLLMADKSRVATVDGLNQRFRVRRAGRQVSVAVAPGTDEAALGDPILTAVPVDQVVDEITGGMLEIAGATLPFSEAIRELAAARREDRIIGPTPGAACGACQFRAPAPPASDESRSGFHECWSSAFHWTERDFT